MLEAATARQGLSARAHDRIHKVSRTIADLDPAEEVRPAYVAGTVGRKEEVALRGRR